MEQFGVPSKALLAFGLAQYVSAHSAQAGEAHLSRSQLSPSSESPAPSSSPTRSRTGLAPPSTAVKLAHHALSMRDQLASAVDWVRAAIEQRPSFLLEPSLPPPAGIPTTQKGKERATDENKRPVYEYIVPYLVQIVLALPESEFEHSEHFVEPVLPRTTTKPRKRMSMSPRKPGLRSPRSSRSPRSPNKDELATPESSIVRSAENALSTLLIKLHTGEILRSKSYTAKPDVAHNLQRLAVAMLHHLVRPDPLESASTSAATALPQTHQFWSSHIADEDDEVARLLIKTPEAALRVFTLVYRSLHRLARQQRTAMQIPRTQTTLSISARTADQYLDNALSRLVADAEHAALANGNAIPFDALLPVYLARLRLEPIIRTSVAHKGRCLTAATELALVMLDHCLNSQALEPHPTQVLLDVVIMLCQIVSSEAPNAMTADRLATQQVIAEYVSTNATQLFAFWPDVEFDEKTLNILSVQILLFAWPIQAKVLAFALLSSDQLQALQTLLMQLPSSIITIKQHKMVGEAYRRIATVNVDRKRKRDIDVNEDLTEAGAGPALAEMLKDLNAAKENSVRIDWPRWRQALCRLSRPEDVCLACTKGESRVPHESDRDAGVWALAVKAFEEAYECATTSSQRVNVLRLLRHFLTHAPPTVAACDLKRSGLGRLLIANAASEDARIALAVLPCLCSVAKAHALADPSSLSPLIARIHQILSQPQAQSQMAGIVLIRTIAVHLKDDPLHRLLLLALSKIASPNVMVEAFAIDAVTSIAAAHDVTLYKLLQPIIKEACQTFMQSAQQMPERITTLADLLSISRANFLKLTAKATLPVLVLRGHQQTALSVAAACGQDLSTCCIAYLAAILGYLYLQPPSEARKAQSTLVNWINSGQQTISVDRLIHEVTDLHAVLSELLVELGHEDSSRRAAARNALLRIDRALHHSSRSYEPSLAALLTPHMLAILTLVNSTLQDKSTSLHRRRMITGLGIACAELGASMATITPQIMATLHSCLRLPYMANVTLSTWLQFSRNLEMSEIAPFVGPMAAAFVRLWPDLDAASRQTIRSIFEHIIGLQEHERVALEGLPDLSALPELSDVVARLDSDRDDRDLDVRLRNLLPRVTSENDSVSLIAARELRMLLVESHQSLVSMTTGSSFATQLGNVMHALLTAATRASEDRLETRNLVYDCIGIIGAIDPDRFEMPSQERSFALLDNFADTDESAEFAIYLIEKVLVSAFKSTNDTRHQQALAFALQELLRFCGFTVGLLDAASEAARQITSKTRSRWAALSKPIVEIVGPMLGSRFTVQLRASPLATYPIYAAESTFRDWLAAWTLNLIERAPGTTAKRVFSPFSVTVRDQDIAVISQLLPYVLLHALISGTDRLREDVRIEVEAILEDQVTPSLRLSPESRALCAQAIFSQMDHLSDWLRRKRETVQKLKRAVRKTKRDADADALKRGEEALHKVEGFLGQIPQELTARAAFQCKSYARSLLNFEKCIVQMGEQKKSPAEIQPYYERLHQIYADLDEPDGMEGISTKILSPSVSHQIREHESTGRWTAAQSCWEVELQIHPNQLDSHLGLLKCLRNLGHYDSMRTHIVGVLHAEPQWKEALAPYEIEAARILADWKHLETVLKQTHKLDDASGATEVHDGLEISSETPEVVFARVIHSLRTDSSANIERTVSRARASLGAPIAASGAVSYRRAYDSIVHLHILTEIQSIYEAFQLGDAEGMAELQPLLEQRLESAATSFRFRESILNMRRSALKLQLDEHTTPILGELWLATSKNARLAGHTQTAYSAVLQAGQIGAPMTFLQGAKLLRWNDQTQRAIQELDRHLGPLIAQQMPNGTVAALQPASGNGCSSLMLAKAALRRARWMHEAERFEHNEVVERYFEAIRLQTDWESPYYHLGHYYDEYVETTPADRNGKKAETLKNHLATLKNFSQALLHGSKYIYQAMPRMLTLWLDVGDDKLLLLKRRPGEKVTQEVSEVHSCFLKMNRHIEKAIAKLPAYFWFTVFPQVVSRILHVNETLYQNLERIMVTVLKAYPHQALWTMISAAKSTSLKRAARCVAVFERVKSSTAQSSRSQATARLIDEADRLVDQMLMLCNHPVKTTDTISMTKTFPGLYRCLPSNVMIPLQELMTVTLPANVSERISHRPFPAHLVTMRKFLDEVEIMASLQKPRKIAIQGDDGRVYSFLCKPKDDLRKDARLMDFNSMINKLLKKDSEARKRRLYIRTYAVVPINEECGLIEWVPHTVGLRGILTKLYEARGILCWSPQLKSVFDTIRDDPSRSATRLRDEVLSQFPPVFHDWFLGTFPEPTSWLQARMAYSRTAAVMSMVGFVLGLGDRHGENILFDSHTGDTVHVDFNCLFDKGRTFEVGERVPFRLTHNIVDGLGVTGIEGAFRRASEVTMRVLRTNKDSLMSVLEAFIHDPLVEWTSSHKARKAGNAEETEDPRMKLARKSLEPIARKLKGLQLTSAPSNNERVATPENQVESLIREATSLRNLSQMYVGWACFF